MILVIAGHVSAQQSPEIIAYYNKSWERTYSEHAEYYRVLVKEDPEGVFHVQDHYISGELEMEAICTGLFPQLVKEGKAVNYYKNGKVKTEGDYSNGQKQGLHKTYFENGQIESEIIYYIEDIAPSYQQYWTEAGQPLISNGAGLVTKTLEDQTTYLEIKDSKLLNAFSVDAQADTAYTVCEVAPEYPGGYEALAQDLVKNLKYPKSARMEDTEGTVYVQFVLDKKGQITNIKVLKGISADCDVAAMRAVSKLKPWASGRASNKFVRVRIVQPVRFKLI